MPLLATALGLSLLGSCGGLLVASSLLLFTAPVRTGWCRGWSATPSARCSAWRCSRCCRKRSTTLSPQAVFGTLLAGILVFFVLEKLVLLRHCHTDECQVHGATAPLVFIGDAFHNFIDGAIICTAVLTSVPLGINTAIAVAAHEIPQEVGDVAILLAAGYSRGRALLLNIVSGASGIARRARRVRRGRSRARNPAVRPRVLVGQPALHRDVGSDSRSASRRRSTPTPCARSLLIAAGIGTIVRLRAG